jgi:hypothetical protein
VSTAVVVVNTGSSSSSSSIGRVSEVRGDPTDNGGGCIAQTALVATEEATVLAAAVTAAEHCKSTTVRAPSLHFGCKWLAQ